MRQPACPTRAGYQSALYSKNPSAIVVALFVSSACCIVRSRSHESPRFVNARDISEIRDELRHLMEEQVNSLTAQAFGGLGEEESRQQDQRLKRIREVSADLLVALKRNGKRE
jgi:hypothetical protein